MEPTRGPSSATRVMATVATWTVAALMCAWCVLFTVANPSPASNAWFWGLLIMFVPRFPAFVLILAIVVTFQIWSGPAKTPQPPR